MATQHVDAFVDTELSVPGHTALVAYNHSTRARSLSCDDCAEHLGRFLPDRWLAKQIREAWEKHFDPWCKGVRIAETGSDGRHVAAKCGSTSTHAGHWTDGRDYLDETDNAPNPGGEA